MFENNEDPQCMSGLKVFLCLTWFMMNVRPRVILGQTHQRADKTDCSGTCIATCSNMQPSVRAERRNVNTGNTDFLGQQAGQPTEHYIPSWLPTIRCGEEERCHVAQFSEGHWRVRTLARRWGDGGTTESTNKDNSLLSTDVIVWT